MTQTRRRAFLAGSAAAWTIPIALPAMGQLVEPLDGLSDAFLRIDLDGTITCILSTCEMGQGTHTSQSAILAEELGADWEAIQIDMPKQPADPYRLPFGQMRSVGSFGIRFFHDPMRRAAAQMRTVLIVTEN